MGAARRVSLSPTALRKAASKLGPPTEDMLLDVGVLRASRNLRLALAKPKRSQKDIASVLSGIKRADNQGQPVRDMPFSSFSTIQKVSIISQIMRGLYEPTDTFDLLVPPQHRYKFPTFTNSSVNGSGFANIATGQLHTLQSVNLAATTESTFAAFYGQFDSDHSGLVTLQADINWQAHHNFSSDPVWNRRLDGWVWLYSYVWLIVWVLNRTTGIFERIPGVSATRIPLLTSTWYVDENGAESSSGSLNYATARLQFQANNPPQTYAVGVVCQGIADHDIRNVDGNPLPPAGNNFIVYALTALDVPDMFVTS